MKQLLLFLALIAISYPIYSIEGIHIGVGKSLYIPKSKEANRSTKDSFVNFIKISRSLDNNFRLGLTYRKYKESAKQYIPNHWGLRPDQTIEGDLNNANEIELTNIRSLTYITFDINYHFISIYQIHPYIGVGLGNLILTSQTQFFSDFTNEKRDSIYSSNISAGFLYVLSKNFSTEFTFNSVNGNDYFKHSKFYEYGLNINYVF